MYHQDDALARVEDAVPATAGLITSAWKIAAQRERLQDYLAGKPIYPLAVEFDLTDKCNRSCEGCPSVKATAKHFLTPEFVDRLLGILEGHAQGLLFTGGEPTIAPLFPQTLSLARKRGFMETAVISNGICLNDPAIISALLDNATALRVSLYDWQMGTAGPLGVILSNIEALRKSIEQVGSPLEIGVSVLTDHSMAADLEWIVGILANSGIHWVYFHPRCENWELGRPVIVNQAGVVDALDRVREHYAGVLPVLAGEERYSRERLKFSKYHAANFLMVIGADCKNYLSPETKYNPDFVLADLSEGITPALFTSARRLEKMEISSAQYSCIGSRHRTVLYNSLIEKLLAGAETIDRACRLAKDVIHPYIL